MIIWIQYCVDGTGDVIRIQLELKTYLMSVCNSWSIYWEGGAKFVSLETRLHIVNFSETKSRMYSMEGKSERNSYDGFFIVHWSGSTHMCS